MNYFSGTLTKYYHKIQFIYISLMMKHLINIFSKNFSKWSRPKPKLIKTKEEKKSPTLSDQKAAKLSKSQQQMENKQKIIQEEKIKQQTQRKLSIYKKQDISLEGYINQQDLDRIWERQMLYLRGISAKMNHQKDRLKLIRNYKSNMDKYLYLPTDKYEFNSKKQLYVKTKPVYGNFTQAYNRKLNIKKLVTRMDDTKIKQQFDQGRDIRRMGCLGVKMGMTILWDDWGKMVPVTVIELDRVQVVQIKQLNEQFSNVQLGIGQKNIKRITKPLLGHYLKSRVPPKRKLAEFKVSNDCLLPIGCLISPRHYTPGMYVDVVSKTVGHGTQGTIKRFGFRRQPQTHGNSLTTRVLGSTGGRQDPGRVFKQKKMYGKMGNKITTQRGLQVFKIDIDKNLIFLTGSVPGKAGTIVKIRDTLLKHKAEVNLSLVSFPTFIQEQGKKYARQLSMYCGQRDPSQIQIHDNAYIIDDGQDESAFAPPTKQIPDDDGK